MNGLTNAGSAGGGLQVLASESLYPDRNITLSSPAKFILVAYSFGNNAGQARAIAPGVTINLATGYSLGLSEDGLTIYARAKDDLEVAEFFALG